jgi:hypothetical protein
MSSRKNKLIEKALAIAGPAMAKVNITDDEIELAVAWLKGVINTRQLLGVTGSKCATSWALPRIKLAVVRGLLTTNLSFE